MKTNLYLQFGLLLIILLATSSEGFFLEYPKKLIMNFLNALKEKKEAKKMLNGIHHYHVHYYPYAAHSLHGSPVKAPNKHELDEIHNKYLASLGWTNSEYKYVPEPKHKIPLGLIDSWDDAPHVPEIINHSDENILVEVPYGEKIIIEHPYVHKKTKKNLLSSLFHKFADSEHSP